MATRKNIILCIGIFILITTIICIIIKKKCRCSGSCSCKTKKESFVNNSVNKPKINPLYMGENVNYTQPPGDVESQRSGRSGQGTNGGFLPLQGNGSQIMMANSNNRNEMVYSKHKGVIGGFPNYTGKKFTSSMNGFNNFGKTFKNNPAISNEDYSNSYLIDGNNERVQNAGQKGHLKCQDWWPNVKKNSDGFCTTNNDSIATCDLTIKSKNLSSCKNGVRYIKSKMEPQWKKVV